MSNFYCAKANPDVIPSVQLSVAQPFIEILHVK
jgi:hypothetical protein